jgi:hypothetical protein
MAFSAERAQPELGIRTDSGQVAVRRPASQRQVYFFTYSREDFDLDQCSTT